MHTLALILFLPTAILTLLVLYVYVAVNALKAVMGLFSLIMGLSDIGGPQGFKNITDFWQVFVSVLGWWVMTLFLFLVIMLPISISAYFYVHGKQGLAVSALLITLCVSAPFISYWFNLARHGGGVPAGADPASYEVLPYSIYAKDATHVFNTYSGTVVQGADPTTFALDSAQPRNYAKDKNHIYDDKGNIISEADPKSFVTVGSYGYAKDATHVWWRSRLIPEADPATFTTISGVYGEYGKDTQHVYHTIHLGEMVDGTWIPLEKKE